jgi:protein PhnA
MSLERDLKKRSDSKCELCGSIDDIKVYEVQPAKEGSEYAAMICNNCLEQIEDADKINVNHWRCLNDSMWSEVPAVQAIAWRMLNQIKNEGWPQDMMYMEEETAEWAKAIEPDEDAIVHLNSNGVKLEAGDTVVLIKDLAVKGTSMIAKRGVAVRRISLDQNNPNHIEGKVDGQHIMII